MKTVDAILKIKSRFEADNDARLTGIEVSVEDFDALQKFASGSYYVHRYSPFCPSFLTIDGVTISKRAAFVSPAMLAAGVKEMRRGELRSAEDLEQHVSRIYQSMEAAK